MSRRGRRGFTLVEIVVAMVVFEVGLLGVVGTLILAATTVAEAQVLEEATAALEGAYEALRAGRPPEPGWTRAPTGEIRWTLTPAGAIRLEWVGGDGDRPVVVSGWRDPWVGP